MKALQASPWVLLNTPAQQLTESPRYAHQRWIWLDIDGQCIYRCKGWNMQTGESIHLQSQALPESFGCVIPTQTPEQLLLFGRSGVYLAHWSLDTNQCSLNQLAPAPFDSKNHRFNDGRADGQGRVWISSLSDDRTATASLYCWESAQFSERLSGLIVGNGSAFSPNFEQFYWADTRHRKIWGSNYDQLRGLLGDPKVMADYTAQAPARPDGACVLADGSYVVAIYEGGRLDRYQPDGQLIESISTPFLKPTMPCVGGPDLRSLCVTAAFDPSNPRGYTMAMCTITTDGLPEPLVTLAD